MLLILDEWHLETHRDEVMEYRPRKNSRERTRSLLLQRPFPFG